MPPHIISVGRLAKRSLNGASGTVLTVFESSAYLENSVTDELVCVGTQALPDGPINVRTSLIQLPSLQTGNQWYCRNENLTIEDIASLQYKPDRFTHNETPDLLFTSPAEPKIVELLRSHLPHHLPGAFNEKLKEHLQPGIQALTQWLQCKPDLPPTIQLQNLIGCGEGLTPTGDDILIGALITLKHTNRMEQFTLLSDWVKANAAILTNRISLAHLHAACEGHAVALLHNVLNAISCNDATQVQQTLAKLDQYGHRSGRDALYGMLTVLQNEYVKN